MGRATFWWWFGFEFEALVLVGWETAQWPKFQSQEFPKEGFKAAKGSKNPKQPETLGHASMSRSWPELTG